MPVEITNQDAQYAFDIVEKVCREVGPGLPASPQERERAAIIKKELQTHLGVDNVVEEEFTLAPGAFLSTYPGVFCMLVAILLNILNMHIIGIASWITALIALVFSLFPPVSFILEFLLSHEVFDRFYPKKQSTNVIGRLRRSGGKEAKHLLIISGHHDSAPQNTWIRYTGYGFYLLSATFFIGILTLVVVCLIQLAGLIIGNDSVIHAGTLSWILLVYPIVPAMIYAAFFTRGTKNGGTVPGAADNLSACAVTVAMCRFLVQNPEYIPEETELRFITFGSEEAGLRGSRRYVERHLGELKQMDARVLNYEIVAHPEISILATDLNGTLKYSLEMVKIVVAAAQRAGVPYKVSKGSIGAGCDSVPFHRAGLQSITLSLFKTPQQLFAFYHQDRDTPKVLTIEPFLNALKLTLEWIRNSGK
jgi:hypothetical protein